MQLDLFSDNRNVLLQNDVIAALRRRDPIAGGRMLTILASEYPDDRLLNSLSAVLTTLTAAPQRFRDHNDAVDALHEMDNLIVPSANLVFGPRDAREWLAPMWRSLANSAAGLAYSVEKPHAHPAFMLLRAGDWVAAESKIAEIPSWRRIPQPLAWMAEARFGQGGLEPAWCLLAELAWIDASGFCALVHRLDAPALNKLLAGFDAAFEAGDPADFAWFPAWVLIAEPTLASVLRETQVCGNNAPERSARVMIDLLALERKGRHADLVAQRKRLRDLHAGLFSRYMATR